MSSKRRLRRRQCENKQTHTTEQEAWKHCDHLKIRFQQRWRPYKCRFCGKWHVGRPGRERMRKVSAGKG